MGIIAIAASVAGLNGQAVSAASNASCLEEEADYVQFALNGLKIKGWVWRSPFKNCDSVEVAAEWQDDHYEIYGIARPADRVIALYPHCSRGRARHIKNAVKWWAWALLASCLLLAMPLYGTFGTALFSHPLYLASCGALAVFFALMFFSLTRKWLPFVKIAEKVFETFGWHDPGNIDLIKSSVKQRTENDAVELGTFYFRY